MKIYRYSFLVLFVMGIMLSCKDNPTDNDETETTAHSEGNEHLEGGGEESSEEVSLTTQQFEALQMKIDTLSKRVMSGFVEANGTLEVPPQNEAAITSVVGANVVSIEVIEGDKVSKGEVVAYLSHPNIIKMQTDYLNSNSNSVFLKKDFERQKKLYDAGVGSGMNFQKAEAEYNASTAMVNGLAEQLRLLNINPASVVNGTIAQRIGLRSPIDGFVENVTVKTGQFVEPQTELFEIVDTHHVHADLMVFEKDVSKVKKGQKVSFSVQSFPEEELSATIVSIGKTFEETPKAIHVHAEIDNKKGNLIPGMYIQGKIETDTNTKIDALPESAIIKEGDVFYAFTAEKEEGVWHFKPVQVILGATEGNWTAVQFLEPIGPNAQFAYNNAYYLIAEMKKGEAEHSH